MYMPPSAVNDIERIEIACRGLSVWQDLTKWPALAGVLIQLHSLCLVRIGARCFLLAGGLVAYPNPNTLFVLYV